VISFKEKYLKGECTIEELDDYVDIWHKGSTGKSLQKFLGFSNEEYAAFGRDETIIKKLLDSPKYSDEKAVSETIDD
jgi:hypothetical protein